MENIKKYLGIIIFVLVGTVALLVTPQGMTQTPPPPNNGTTGSGGTTPVGGGAPVGGGLLILVSIALTYGYARYTLKKPDYTVEEKP